MFSRSRQLTNPLTGMDTEMRALLVAVSAALTLTAVFAVGRLKPAMAVASTGADFYVSQSTGSDTNSGTSPDDAWQTVAKVNGEIFNPGDTIHFQRGDLWDEDLDLDPSGAAGLPITIGAYGTGSPPVLRRLTIDGDWTVISSLTVDHQGIESDAVRVRAKNVTLQSMIIRNGGADGVDASDADGLLIEDCLIHHFLAGSFSNQADAHGVVATDIQGLTIRQTEIHHVSGDSFQADPSRSPNVPMDILIEDAYLWTGPLAADFNNWNAGEVPGENAIDTKVADSNWDAVERATFTIRNIRAHGWINDGFISNRAVFNMKEKIDALFDGVTVYDSEIAFRIRGTRGNANVTMMNVVVYDVQKAIRAEDDLQNLNVYNSTFGGNIDTLIQTAGGAAGVGSWDLRNNAFLNQAPPSQALDPTNRTAVLDDFSNAGAEDYKLAPMSGLIDDGTALPAVGFDRDGVARPQGAAYDIGAYEYQPMLQLSGYATSSDIFLGWQTTAGLPVSATWELVYAGGPATPASPITGILSPTRHLTLTGAAPFTWYTATVSAVVNNAALYSDTFSVWTSDIRQSLPAIRTSP